MCVCACVCDITWGWYSEPTTSSSMYEPSTNKDQKNTKAWVQCMFFLFFSRMSASAFQRFDSCSAVKQKPFGKLIRLHKLFRFLMQLNVKSSIFHSALQLKSSQTRLLVSLFSPRQWPGAFCWSRCRGGCRLFFFFFLTGVFLLVRKKRRCVCDRFYISGSI